MEKEELFQIIKNAAKNEFTELNLSIRELKEIPVEIGQLTCLNHLHLSNNELKEIPAEIGQLASLTYLDLSNNELKELPPEIGQLTSLAYLYLSNNKLKELPPEIGQLASLTKLELRSNELKELPPEIGQLARLTKLELRSNELKELPSQIEQLTKLTELDLSSNQLKELPSQIGQLTSLTSLYLNKNPLISPPLEIVKQGIKSIKKYLASLEGESKILNEVKILLVGEGSAGKTSLTKRVLGEKFNQNEPTTHGIRIKDWWVEANNKTVKVNIWDFGGQEIMHATHQFFLSKRSLYILVLDGRRDERPEYWLRNIESFGGDSPVLIVLNKYDANPGFDINRPFLQKKYPGIKGFYRTSCATAQGIEEFKEALIKELTQVKLIETRWANSWFQVKQRLENLKEHYISYDQYEKICTETGVTEEFSQDVLVDFLHDLGVIVHFREFDLEDTHVLEPKWVTTAVYKIINSEKVAASSGILKLRDLREILQQQDEEDYFYPRSKYKYIIGLMKKFELCYSLNQEKVLIPQLLNVVEPEFDFDYETSLKFTLSYNDFLPLSIMPRFIVKRHQDIKGESRWRTGVVLENEAFQSIAVVRADNEANRIDIYVNGQGKKDYLAVILLFFREINDSFEKLKVDERVPMPDSPENTASYKTLMNYARKGIDQYIPDGSDKVYSVQELLGLVQLDEQRSVQEILDILQRIEGKVTDEKSFMENANRIIDLKPTFMENINRIIDLKPNFMGIGVNLNEAFDKAYKAYQTRKDPKPKPKQIEPGED